MAFPEPEPIVAPPHAGGHSLGSERWLERKAYRESWLLRSQEITAIIAQLKWDIQQCTVYGCGPNHVFERALEQHYPEVKFSSYDLKQWDEHTTPCNLTTQDIRDNSRPDLIALIGVLEYVNPVQTIQRALQSSRYVALSYAPRWSEASMTHNQRLFNLQRRIRRGWRSHLSTEDLLQAAQNHGFLHSIGNLSSTRGQIYGLLEAWQPPQEPGKTNPSSCGP